MDKTFFMSEYPLQMECVFEDADGICLTVTQTSSCSFVFQCNHVHVMLTEILSIASR